MHSQADVIFLCKEQKIISQVNHTELNAYNVHVRAAYFYIKLYANVASVLFDLRAKDDTVMKTKLFISLKSGVRRSTVCLIPRKATKCCLILGQYKKTSKRFQ